MVAPPLRPSRLARRRCMQVLGLGALAAAVPRLHAQGAAPQVCVLGAGWAGLAALKALRQAAAPLDVTLIDRDAAFRSLPLSNPWLSGHQAERGPRLALAAHAAAAGARFVAAEVRAIDRVARRLALADGRSLRYDALLLAPGAVADPRAWWGDDARAAAEARHRWPGGFAASELDDTRRGWLGFEGGELVMTIPAAPLRCPPAPYERAVLLADAIRRRGLKARLTLLDAGGGLPRFNRLFRERWAGVIDHRLHVQLHQVDPFERRLASTEGELRWDHALLLPPLHAGALAVAAGLTGQDAQGRPGRWLRVDARTLRSAVDAHTWVAGDALDAVSPLFGPYPKTAQVAAETGAAAARHLAATLAGQPAPEAALPTSECHVWLSADPPELLQLDVSHRRRGDGEIVQAVRQLDNPQPRGEDAAWLSRLWQQAVL